MSYLSIGQVSKRFKLSLRTLRYYDEIGLLQPALVEANGKRYYSPENLLTLEKITLLKSTSLSLVDIQKIMKEVEISTILSLHKDLLEQELLHLQQSISHTTALINLVKLEGTLNWEQLLPLVEKNKGFHEEKTKIINHYFNEDEQQRLAERLPKLEQDDDHSKKWMHLMKRTYLCVEKGLPTNSEEAQLIAADLQLLTKETFNGDDELAEKFWEIRKSEELSQSMNLYPIKQEILEYMEEVLYIFDSQNIVPKA